MRLPGYVGTEREGLTPRALIPCLRSVQSPLRTDPRHLIGAGVRDAGCQDMKRVPGYIKG
jgi:hypothetical protein